MSGEGLASTTRYLVLALSVLYVVAALGGFAFLDFGTTRDVVLWASFLLVGAGLMLLGQLALPRGARSAILVSLGAAIGGLPLFWTLLVPVAVAAVIACSIALARRAAPAA
jgi:hypothetical protein